MVTVPPGTPVKGGRCQGAGGTSIGTVGINTIYMLPSIGKIGYSRFS